MKKLIYLIVIIVAFGLIVSGCIPVVPPTEQSEPTNLTRNGTNYYVRTDGSDSNTGLANTPGGAWFTINKGTCSSSPLNSGDILHVADGTYTITGRIWVEKAGITVSGNTASPGNVIVQYSPVANLLIFDMRANDVTVEGIKTISGKSGFFFDQSATGCTISHCIIENAYESGVYIYNGNGHTVEYTTITNPGQMGNLNYSNGIYTRAASTTIDHCTISSDKVKHMKWGIDLEAGSSQVITGNTITGVWQAAIRAASGVKPVTITNNDIDDATQGYAYEAAISLAGHNDGSTISGNHIDDVVASSAIGVWNAWDIAISGNQIGADDALNDVRLEGIRVSGCGGSGANRVEVTGNTIHNTGYAAVLLINSDNTYVYSNIIEDCNNYGADNTGDWDYASIHVDENSDNVIVDNNDISDGINGIQVWGDSCTVTNNTIYDMGFSYDDTKGTGDGTYYNSGIIIGSNWLTSNFKPTGTTITGNNIHDNYWGLYVRDYATLSSGDPSVLSVIATCNWWGDNSSPSGPGGTGSGDAVSLNVDYNPWLTQGSSLVYTGAPQPENSVVLKATLSDSTGISGMDVEFYLEGSPVGFAATDSNGVASFTMGSYPVGVYEVYALVCNLQSEAEYLAVYDLSEGSGFITGGGWIDSPPGAYIADETLSGKASFGFVSKYKKGQSTPTGNTEFQFKAGNLNFHSDSYEWLVVAGDKAMYKGIGTVNGADDFRFMIFAIDSDPDDKFRIKIWDRGDDDTVVYDNGCEGPDGTVLGGGQIIIHKGK